MAINWSVVKDEAGTTIAGLFLVMIIGLLVLLSIVCCLTVPIAGIVMTMRGFWFIGVPVFLFGAVVDIGLLVLVVVNVMALIQERKRDGD